MTFLAFDSISEFQSAREVYQVLQEKIEGGRELLTTGESLVFKVAAAKVRSLVRKEILEKDGGGQKFLYSHGLLGLVTSPRDFLDKTGSLGSVLRCFFPGVVDENNEDAIQPHELEEGWWNDKDYALRQVYRALCKIPALKPYIDKYLKLKESNGNEAELKNEIKEISRVIRKEVLEKGSGTKFLCSHGLSGLVSHPRDFLYKRSSLGSVLRCFFPGVVDENNEDAIQPHEIDYKC